MMTRITSELGIVVFLVSALSASCQDKATANAQFPGESTGLERYITDNLRWNQEQLTVEGKVFVSFIVTESGEKRSVKIEKSLNANCDSAAVQLIKTMPNWIPARKNGKPVSSKVMIPIPFKLYKEN